MTREDFESKVKNIRPKLTGYALSLIKDKEEAEDSVQDTFLKLWFRRDSLSKYRSFDAVAFVVLRRLIINKLRTKGIKVSLEEIYEKNIDTPLYEEDYCDEILDALDSLPSVEQAVMRLKHVEDMETEEIAALIGSNPGAVRVALSRARKKIRDRFVSRR